MCGIVGGVAERNILPILLEGLRRLEYRGYDSAGIALIQNDQIRRVRATGKIKKLQHKIETLEDNFAGSTGIAHTRWATHGAPSEHNAHPHLSHNQICLVHNGIIENYQALKNELITCGYNFESQTDTEVIAHLIHFNLQTATDFLNAVQKTLTQLEGAYALAAIHINEPETLVIARKGSPLVIGVGFQEYFIASDTSALLPVTQNFIFLEDGDTARLTRFDLKIFAADGSPIERPVKLSTQSVNSVELGEHRHFMHKEIFEQPKAVMDTLEARITHTQVLPSAFGAQAPEIFAQIEHIQIIACGTSYHAGLVAKYWFEDIIGLPCQVEVASEYRYRNPFIANNTLLVTISQSGETADTLAALQQIKEFRQQKSYQITTLSICNVAESSLTRESDLVFLTHAGPEIGVASTKAFTTQLVALALLLTAIGRVTGKMPEAQEQRIVNGLQKLPSLIHTVLAHENTIEKIATQFADKEHALFLGRGTMYPIAMEGALKLKEISYIHAEAYPAGELKHGPLALIDDNMPVIAVAPMNDLLEKLKSNLQEVKARGGQMIVFEDEQSDISSESSFVVLKVTQNLGRITSPIVFNIALQLLSYHVALIKGTDVDQPRNLAKSVTVE
jgi:glucosamine--fructose-6-phosphate aminotransferase (isomerizing)